MKPGLRRAVEMLRSLRKNGELLGKGVKRPTEIPQVRLQRIRRHRSRLKIWDRPPQPLQFVDMWGIDPEVRRDDILDHLEKLGISGNPYVHLDWRSGCDGEPGDDGGSGFLVFENSAVAAEASRMLHGTSIKGQDVEADLAVNVTLDADDADDAAEGHGAPPRWWGAAQVDDADETVPDWLERDGDADGRRRAGAAEDPGAAPAEDAADGSPEVSLAAWPARSSFQAVEEMMMRRLGCERDDPRMGELTWLRLSPISRFATRQDVALLVDRLLRSDSSGSMTRIKWFCLNPARQQVEVPRQRFKRRIFASSPDGQTGAGGQQDAAGGLWSHSAGGFEEALVGGGAAEDEPEPELGPEDTAAGDGGELALLAVDPLVDVDWNITSKVLVALSDRAAASAVIKAARRSHMTCDEVVSPADYNFSTMASVWGLDARSVHISRVSLGVKAEEVRFFLRNFDVADKGIRMVPNAFAGKRYNSWVVTFESEEEAFRAVRELHRAYFVVKMRREAWTDTLGKKRDPRRGQVVVLPMK